ncbi:MAG: hypothetical protein AAGH87_06585 [Pseudomonadota bacterium]
MTVAKYTFFELIRALRRLGAVGLFVMGLIVGSTVIAATGGETSQEPSGRFIAAAATGDEIDVRAPPTVPWSRVLGEQPFEKITDVAMTRDTGVVFAGLSFGVDQAEAAHAMVVRTGPHGFVHTQSRIRDPRLGSVSRARVDDDGSLRLVHWVGSSPAFARASLDGDVVWSRTFKPEAAQAWADIAAARGEESLIAMASGVAGGQMLRVVRLDEAGRVVWRSALEPGGEIDTFRLFDSGDGGAMVAFDVALEDGGHRVSIVRFDRRGRRAWSRDLVDAPGVRLGDAFLGPRGSTVLLAGAPSVLIHLDGLGQLHWMQDLPALSQEGRHLVAADPEGVVQIMAEPADVGAGRQHYLARFDLHGRELWSRRRSNRTNANLVAAEIAPNGVILAGGSMVSSATGDTDMLMMAVSANGRFPSGFGAAISPDSPPPASLGMVAAALELDGSQTLEAAFAADTAARLADTAVPALYSGAAPSAALAEVPAEPSPPAVERALGALPPAETEARRMVSAPLGSLSEADAPGKDSAGVSPAPQPAATLERALGAASESDQSAGAEKRDASAGVAYPARWSPLGERPVYAYECTFTCLADSEDVVRYPVTRIIANVAEYNSSLVSLDVMAMDRGICLATGGRVFDAPRLPPVCDRMD